MKFLNKISKKVNQITYKNILSETISNIKANLKYTKKCNSIAALRKNKIEKIGVIVGSGPSLRKIDQTKYLKNLDTLVEDSDKYLKKLDERGVFQSDDEIGFFFEQLKE